MNAHLRGAFLVTKAFLPDMLRQQRGVVANLVAFDAISFSAPYLA